MRRPTPAVAVLRCARATLRALPAAVGAAIVAAALAQPAGAQQTAWEQWQRLPGIVDVGVRSDGTLVAMAAGRLYLVTPGTGTFAPFADGADGFAAANPDAESYFVITPPLSVESAACTWTADDLFVLDLATPVGLARVDSSGRASRFATLPGVSFLSGIAMDTVGSFGYRLLITGTQDDKTTVFGVDCLGSVGIVTDAAPPMEGGLAVAPLTFGQFAGHLIAPDEHSGQVWAIDPLGTIALVAIPNLPTGGDIGVESAGFVPPGFSSGGLAYLADRGTPNNPFPGTDSILRVSSSALLSAGAAEGDLLLSIEGGGTTVAIRCDGAGCAVTQVASGPAVGHIEGKIAFTLTPPSP